MHAALLRVASREEEGSVDVQLKAWARDVRETSYDVEDCIDAFTTAVHLTGVSGDGQGPNGSGAIKNFFHMCTQFLAKVRVYHKFADQISELKARVVEVGDRRDRYDMILWKCIFAKFCQNN